MSATANKATGLPATPRRMAFRPDIEGLRALAIVLVVADHLGVRGFKGGFVGVENFFVISGFLITGLLADEREAKAEKGPGRVSLLGFYERRARRILPAALTVIAVVLVVAKLDYNFIRFREVQADAFWATVFAANLHLMQQATDYFAINRTLSPLQNYWSLAVEEQFYLVWPLVLIATTAAWNAAKRRGARMRWESAALSAVVVLGFTSFTWALVKSGNSPVTAYYSPFTRAWQLALGAALALWSRRSRQPAVASSQAAGLAGLGLIAIGLVVIRPSSPIPGSLALLPTVGAALLLWGGGHAGTVTDTLFSLRPVRFVGRISYSLYLWHWPLIVFAAGWLWISDISQPVRGGVLLIASLMLAWLSWQLIEQPFRRRRGGKRLWMGVVSASVLVVLAVSVRPQPSYPHASAAAAGVPILNWPQKLAEAQATATVSKAALELAAAGRNLGPVGCWEVTTVRAMEQCSLNGGGLGGIAWPAGVSRNVVLYGNSFAAQWRQTVAAILPRSVRLTTISATACDPVDTDTAERNKSGQSCAGTTRFALDQVARRKPEIVLFSMAVVRDQAKTREFLRSLKLRARHVLWIGGAPAAKSFERCLGRDAQVSACNASPERVKLAAAFDSSFSGLAFSAGAGYVGLTDVYCVSSGCPGFVAEQPIRTDGVHLTNFGMRAAAGKLSAALAMQLGSSR